MSSAMIDEAPPSRRKRCLTPYNLFYRFKRAEIIKAISRSSGTLSKAEILTLMCAIPGLEGLSSSELKIIHPQDIFHTSRDMVLREMKGNLLPFEGKRAHCKTHPGMINFIEMGRMMCDQWKLVDESTKSIFKELAVEGKRLHRLGNSKKGEKLLEDLARDEGGAPVVEGSDEHVFTVNNALPLVSFKAQDHTLFQDLARDEGGAPVVEGSDVFAVDKAMPLLTANTQDDTAPSQSIPYSPKRNESNKVNIDTPVASQISFGAFEEKSLLDSSSDDEDEFCQFIDSHIHLVDGVDLDALNLEEFSPITVVDLVNMDESMNHCNLAAVYHRRWCNLHNFN
jgi:hypothetical protein